MQSNNFKNNKKGFTLIELLIVIAIIAIIVAVVFIALDPLTRFRDSRNAQRWQDIASIADSIRLYQVDNNGQVPTGLDENWRMLGTDITGCDISCGSGGSSGTSSFTDNDSTSFNLGSYSDTQWDSGNTWVELTATGQTNGTGIYTSEIKDANASVTWSTLSWIPERPTGKPLPNSGNSESAYSVGNANMSNNVLLYHLDESSGAIVDNSGQSNNGTNSGATYGVNGKLNTALDFNGTSDIITGPSSNSITGDNLQTITLSAWIKHIDSGDNGYIISVKRSATPSTLVSLDAGNTGAGNLGLLTRHADNSTHSWLNHNGGYNDGQWHHLVGVIDGANRILYIDGVQRNSDSNGMQSVAGNTAEFTVGGFHSTNLIAFDGQIDEVVIWRRALSSTEVADIYKRGTLRLKSQIRSCDDVACSGESFIGPDGTGSTYYSEANNTSVGLPSFSLTNIDDNQYFQYRTTFETDNSSYTPELNSITMENNGGTGETLQSSCLDLSSDLSSKLISIPQDPTDGNANKTYYATRRQTTKQIDVISCGAEGGEVIKVSR